MIGELPKDWEVRTLGEVTHIFKGGTPKRNVERYFQGNIAWATPTDITKLNGALYIDDTETHISEEALGKSAARLLPVGTVLLTSRATIGKVAIARVPIATNQGFANFLCKEKIVNVFLAYYLKLNTDLLISLGTGTTFLEVTKATLLNVEIPLPPLPTQCKIATILSTLDDKIELNRQMNATLEAMARAIFKSWFVDFDPVRAKMEGRPPAGMDAETAALFPSAFQDSPLGKIPKGWEVGTLGKIAKNIRRNVKVSEINPGEFYIGLEHMPRRNITLSQWQTADKLGSNKYRFRKGEILFGKLRPYFHKVGVAPLGGVCSTDILVIQPINSEWFGIVLGFVCSEEFVAYTSAYSAGTRMPRTNWRDMSRYEIVFPQVKVAQKYTEFIRPLIERIIENIHQSHTLSQIRDALLPKLISGEFDVSELDINTDGIGRE